MRYRLYSTVEDTLKEWEKLLNINTKNQMKFQRSSNSEDTLEDWAYKLNSLSKKSSITFKYNKSDPAQTVLEWEKLLNKLF
jgi:hypothetical protein